MIRRSKRTGSIEIGSGIFRLCIFPFERAIRLHLGKKTYASKGYMRKISGGLM